MRTTREFAEEHLEKCFEIYDMEDVENVCKDALTLHNIVEAIGKIELAPELSPDDFNAGYDRGQKELLARINTIIKENQ